MREATIHRKTNETDIHLTLALDRTDAGVIDTGCGFLDHMLTLFARHGQMYLDVTCKGDTYVDYHHTVEDVGICLGQAFAQAIADKRGISRYGSVLLPMDEALIVASADISGRAFLNYDVHTLCPTVGGMDTELIKEFFLAFVRCAQITLHIKQLEGENTHHILEGVFKATGRALCAAVFEDKTLGGQIPSTKGLL